MAESSLLLTHAADLLKAIGMVCAGLWVAYTFHRLQKPLAAELDNRKKYVDVQKGRLEQEGLRAELLGHQPNPEIGIQIMHHADHSSSGHAFLVAIVTIANRGTQNFEIEFTESAVAVARLETARGGSLQAAEVSRAAPWLLNDDNDDLQVFPHRIFRAGAVRRMVFVARCASSGLFALQFRASYRRILFEDDHRTKNDAMWIEAVEQAYYAIGSQPAAAKSAHPTHHERA
jgi:hypothetical protein